MAPKMLKLLSAVAITSTLTLTAHANDAGYAAVNDYNWAIKQLHDAQDTNDAAAIEAARKEVIRTNKAALDAILNGNDVSDDAKWYHDNR